MLSLSSLGRAVLPRRPRPQGRHRLLGRHVPELHAEPDASRGAYRRGEVEVEHWSFLAFSQRLEAAARGLPGDRDALDRRFVDGGERRVTRASRRRSARSACSRRSCRTSRSSTRRSPTAPATSRCTRRCSKDVWGALAARRGAIVTVERVVDDLAAVRRTSCASPRTACSRCARRRSARTPAASSPGRPPGRRLRRGLRLLGRGARRDPARRLRRLDPPLGPRGRRPGRLPRPARCRPRRGAAGQGRAGVVASGPGRVSRPTSTRRPNRWELAATCRVRATSPSGSSRSTPTRCSPGPGVANLAAWLAVAHGAGGGQRRRAHRRDRPLGLRPDARRPVRAEPPQLPAVDDAGRRGDGARARSSAAPARRRSRCLGGAQVDRHGNVNSTLIPGGPFLVGSGGGNDVASVCAEAVVVATLTPQRTPPECGYVTSPGRAVRALVTDLGILEKTDVGARSSSSPRCPPGAEPIADRDRGGAGRVRVGPRRSPRPRSASSRRRPPDEIAALRAAGTPAAGSSATAETTTRHAAPRVGFRRRSRPAPGGAKR